MKRIFKRNQVIATGLAMLIAAAGYLTYAGKNELSGINPDSDAILEDAAVAEAGDIISPEEGMDLETEENPGDTILVSTTDIKEVSAAVKLNREQVRAKSKETLQEIIDNSNLNDAAKEEAVEKLVALTDQEEREAAAENLLTAKGYEDCVVTITDDKVDVAVAAEKLSDMNRAQIEDIVKRKTGVEADAIYITPIQETETGEDTSTETSEETGE